MSRLHYTSTKDDDLLYLLGYRIGDPFLYLETEGKRYVFLSKTDLEAFIEARVPGIEAVDVGPIRTKALASGTHRDFAVPLAVLERYRVQGPITVPKSFPLDMADGLRKEGYVLEVVQSLCPTRVRKSAQEVACLATNAQHTCEAFTLVESILRRARIEGDALVYEGDILTSAYVKHAVESFFLSKNMDCPEGLIVSCGTHAAMPHHSGTGSLRPHQSIVVDIFPQSRENNYFADMTRTYVKGRPHVELTRMYDTVRAAQEAAVALLRPGTRARDVYEASATAIRSAGFDVGDVGYTHSLGHGVGVAVHEAPALSARSEDVLAPGHVVTIEPGLYYLEKGGVRLEDMYVITETGAELLTTYPYELVIA